MAALVITAVALAIIMVAIRATVITLTDSATRIMAITRPGRTRITRRRTMAITIRTVTLTTGDRLTDMRGPWLRRCSVASASSVILSRRDRRDHGVANPGRDQRL
jgi:hypothetical protein